MTRNLALILLKIYIVIIKTLYNISKSFKYYLTSGFQKKTLIFVIYNITNIER